MIQSTGPRIVIITREDKALVVVEKKDHQLKIHKLDIRQAKVVDPTGCGDSLGAGFIAGYIRGWSTPRACRLGLELAYKKVGFTGLDGFGTLKLTNQ
jgi:sugar/nucleoside kinase (ribokinase family)